MKKIGLLILIMPTIALAAKSPEVGGQVTGAEWLRMIAGLAFVVIIIFLLSWILKKIQTAGFAYNPIMKIVTGMSLGGREKLMIVEVNGRYLLLGVAQGSVTLIHDFGTEKPSQFENAKNSSFANVLKAVKGNTA